MATFVQPIAYTKIGTIQKLKGLKGQMIIDLTYPSLAISHEATVYIYLHQTYVPYKVANWQETGSHGVVSLSSVDTRTKAERLQGNSLYMDRAMLDSLLKDSYWGLVDYKVWDMKKGDMGQVIRVEPRPLQPLLVIAFEGEELLVPFHDHFIKLLNHEERQIVLALPEGYIASSLA